MIYRYTYESMCIPLVYRCSYTYIILIRKNTIPKSIAEYSVRVLSHCGVISQDYTKIAIMQNKTKSHSPTHWIPPTT